MYAYILGGMLIGVSPIPIILSVSNIINLIHKNTEISRINPDVFLNSEEIAQKRDEIACEVENLEIPRIIELDSAVSNLEEKCSKKELTLLKYNLQTIKYQRKLFRTRWAGYYDITKNKIVIYDKRALDHEMRHVASTISRIGDIELTGFMQSNIKTKKCIGFGFNEGYTEYLGDKETYPESVALIPLIEMFYDNESSLRQNYYNCDLPAVINHFAQIDGKERAVELIRDIDIMTFNSLYRTWFDKTSKLELSIRENLWDMYQKYSGKKNTEDLFFTPKMLEQYDPQERVLIK